jgi:hypothetical protein
MSWTNRSAWALAALGSLCLAFGGGWPSKVANAADISIIGADDGPPLAQWGAGFEFRRRIATVENPYCDIKTYVVGEYAPQATSANDANGLPAIFIDTQIVKSDMPYAHFLMAHECCHHNLGHVRLTSTRMGQVGPQPFYYIQPLLKGMELEADKCAVRLLKFTNDRAAIDAARQRMLAFGTKPTGAHYPTGVERAETMARSARE